MQTGGVNGNNTKKKQNNCLIITMRNRRKWTKGKGMEHLTMAPWWEFTLKTVFQSPVFYPVNLHFEPSSDLHAAHTELFDSAPSTELHAKKTTTAFVCLLKHMKIYRFSLSFWKQQQKKRAPLAFSLSQNPVCV